MKARLRYFSVIILLVALLSFLIAEAMENMTYDVKNYISTVSDVTDQRMSSIYAEIDNLPRGAGNDVLFLSRLVSLNKFVFNQDMKSDDLKKEVAKDFMEFLVQNKFYQSLALIRSDGSESFKILQNENGEIEINSQPEKNYAGQNYFEVTKNLDKNEVYISDLVANPNGNQPIMYYASPIVDDSGKPGGVLLLTVNVNYFLEDIRNFSRPGEELYLVGNDGRYLANPDQNKEFTHSGSQNNFKKDFGQIADKILPISDLRNLENEKYDFTFRYIRPRLSSFEIYKASEKTASLDSDKNFYWVLASVSDKKDTGVVLADFQKKCFGFLAMPIIILLLIGIIATISYRHAACRIKDSKKTG